MKLDKKILQDFNKASELSWIDKNSRGDYSFSTCIGMNTMRESGLFVVKQPALEEAIVLLSKLEESVFIGSQIHEISTNQFKSNIFPHGYKYIVAFEQNPFVKFTYQIGDRLLQKTLFMLKEQSILIVNYELKNQGSPIDLIIKPFLTSRKNNEISTGAKGNNTDSYIGHDFIRWVPRTGMPELYAYFKNGEYQKATLWYQRFEYNMDKYKYTNWNEDLFNPGFFQVTINPYESFTLFFSTEELHSFSFDYEYIYHQEFLKRENFSKVATFKNRDVQDIFCKLNGAVLSTRNTDSIISSTINHHLSIPDALFSIAGICFVNKSFDMFKNLIKTIITHLDNGVLPEKYNQKKILENDFRADTSLWLIEILYWYYTLTNDIKYIESEIYEILVHIIESYKKNKKFSIKMNSDGLIVTGSPSQDSNWIRLRNNNGMVIRYGKLLEINALWYNAIRIMEIFSVKLDKKRDTAKFTKLAKKIQKSFLNEFYEKNDNQFYDFLNEKEKNESFRINQIIPLALSFSAVTKEQALKVFKRIDDALLTPCGLRSLFKQDKNYISGKEQAVFTKSPAFYNGAIWPFTIGFYIQAFKKFRYDEEQWNTKLWDYFKQILEEKDKNLMGYFPDFLIENSENKCCGFSDYTPSSANIIWAYYLLSNK